MALFVLMGLLWLASAAGVYVHAANRNRDAVLWAAVTLVGGVLGLFLYLLVGGNESTRRGSSRAGPGTATTRQGGGPQGSRAGGPSGGSGSAPARRVGGTGDAVWCPECDWRNPPDNDYCLECGSSLAVVCPNCEYRNRPGEGACAACGRELDTTPRGARG